MSAVPWTNLSELASRFDYFLLDQFGVLRDDQGAYGGAVEALDALRRAGKHIIILSNSGRSGDYNAERFVQLGFARSSFDRFVTSGDVAVELLTNPILIEPGMRAFTISSGGDQNLADRLQLTTVDNAGDANLVIISGSEAEHVSLDAYRKMLQPAAERLIPCVCTNPDIHKLSGGQNAPGAGAIAKLYEELGGTVQWIGKPHREMYETAMRQWGNPNHARIVGVGDSVDHDIKGAQTVGLSSVLVRTGILADLPNENLERIFIESATRPNFLMTRFEW